MYGGGDGGTLLMLISSHLHSLSESGKPSHFLQLEWVALLSSLAPPVAFLSDGWMVVALSRPPLDWLIGVIEVVIPGLF